MSEMQRGKGIEKKLHDREVLKALSEAANSLRDTMRQFVQRRLRAQQTDLTIEMLQVIQVLIEKKESNQQEIANALRKDKASITYLVDNLAKRGLATREEDPGDRRNKIIRLTAAGKKMKNQLLNIVAELHDITGQGLSEDHLQRVTEDLKKIKKNIDEAS